MVFQLSFIIVQYSNNIYYIHSFPTRRSSDLFLTSEKWMAMDPKLLYVTIHPEDTEAYKIWNEMIGLEESRIIRIEGNFWDIGEGPSGPNTQIFYDRGNQFGQNDPVEEMYPGGENERFLEVWNLVFSEFNHNKDHTYTPLPNKNIDT